MIQLSLLKFHTPHKRFFNHPNGIRFYKQLACNFFFLNFKILCNRSDQFTGGICAGIQAKFVVVKPTLLLTNPVEVSLIQKSYGFICRAPYSPIRPTEDPARVRPNTTELGHNQNGLNFKIV